jgi:hypothetical protein
MRRLGAVIISVHRRTEASFGRWSDQLTADLAVSAAVREQRRRVRRPVIGSFDTWPD